MNCHKTIVVLGMRRVDWVIHGASGSSSSHHPDGSSSPSASSSSSSLAPLGSISAFFGFPRHLESVWNDGVRPTYTMSGSSGNEKDIPSPILALRRFALGYLPQRRLWPRCRTNMSCPCRMSIIRLDTPKDLQLTPVKLTRSCSTAGSISLTP